MTQLHSDTGSSPSAERQAQPMDIAIVGMSARVPGARNIDELWSLLMSGKDGISTFEPHEIAEELDTLNEADRARYVPRRGVLPGIEEFDADFFNLSAAEATLLDPQHRVLMEVVWEALEHAGAANCAGQNVGIFSTSGLSHYLIKNLLSDPAISEQHGQLQLLLLNDKDFLATRLAYFLNVHGPAVNLQTGCSSSLVALHYACLSLMQRDCELAIVGGVSLALPQTSGYVFSENMIGSRDGACRAFDRDASGTVRSNGACAVVLKPLADALAAGDTVWAVIKGTAVNNDGRDKVGFTAPSPKWQAEVIASAYRRSGVSLDDIDLVEAHGTGTPLGDPIEARALNQVFVQSDTGRQRYLGALKANIGHLDTAAGLAGLIKVCLSLTHHVIPPTAHFQTLNPRISFERSHFTINTEPVAWRRRDRPRCAALSSFGIGGTNVHVVLAEGPEQRHGSVGEGPYVVTVSAKSAGALAALRQAYIDAMGAMAETDLEDFAYSTRVGRRVFDHRLAICATSRADAIDRLRAASAHHCPRPVAGVRVGERHAEAVASVLGLGLGLDSAPAQTADSWLARIDEWLTARGISLDAGAPLSLQTSGGKLSLHSGESDTLWMSDVLNEAGAALGAHLQAALWRAGVAVRFDRSGDGHAVTGKRMPIPAYRFDRQRYWIGPAAKQIRPPDSSADVSRQTAPAAPRPHSMVSLEAVLLARWRNLLGVAALRSTDNVFDHGADSLTVGQCVSQLISEQSLPIHVVDCYSEPSVSGQTRLIGERMGLQAGPRADAPALEVERFDQL